MSATRSDTKAGLTQEEAWELFDEQTRALLGMSADEFVEKYDSGQLDECPHVPYLSMLREYAT